MYGHLVPYVLTWHMYHLPPFAAGVEGLSPAAPQARPAPNLPHLGFASVKRHVLSEARSENEMEHFLPADLPISFGMRTYEKCACKSPGMRRYRIIGLKVALE